MIRITILVLCLILSTSTFSQDFQEQGGEFVFNPEKVECLTQDQREAIINKIQTNVSNLASEGRLIETTRGSNPLFIWPVQQASGFTYADVWGISNYVDHDSNYPNQLSDFDCGTRTYDTTSGYNHRGLDVYTWPFGWKQMDDDQAEIVAAAPGQIIAKGDGSYDRNCSFNSDPWNAVYVMHADGSVAWYGHMKNGSLTTKNVGDMVTAGEFLGVIGSSGSSTGPHLHFEVWEDNTYTNLIDPYVGPCNPLNSVTWWQSQRPYLNPNINAMLTHSAPPVFPACPTTETTNVSNQFDVNTTIYYAIYLRDQMNGTTVNLKVIQPNDVPLYDWNFDFTADYYSSYWYWSFPLPTAGEWKWEATYNGQTVTHTFNVGTLSVEDESFDATTIYPNPVQDRLTIKSNSFITNLKIVDITGKKVFEYQNEVNGIDNIDTKSLSNGLYFVTLYSDQNEQKTIKLIKK